MDALFLIIGFGAILQGLFLSGLYIFSKKYQSEANRVLGFFLFALIWEGLNAFIPINHVGSYPIGDYFGLPESKIFMPVLFFHFVLAKLNRTKNYRRVLHCNYGIGILVGLLTIVNVIINILDNSNIRTLLGSEVTNTIFMTQQVFAYLLSLLAIVFSTKELKMAKLKMEDFYSNSETVRLKWIQRFVILFVPVVILWGIELLRIFLNIPDVLGLIVTINWAVIFILLYYVSYKAFSQTDLFLDFKIEKSTSKPDEASKVIMEKLESFMQSERYYTNADMNLHDLSKSVNISARKISKAIRSVNSVNFSTWVNAHRVNAAIKLIKENNQLSIEGIGFEVRFKSRSAMYNAFKKIKSSTPGDYK